jgi:hypothetical protein
MKRLSPDEIAAQADRAETLRAIPARLRTAAQQAELDSLDHRAYMRTYNLRRRVIRLRRELAEAEAALGTEPGPVHAPAEVWTARAAELRAIPPASRTQDERAELVRLRQRAYSRQYNTRRPARHRLQDAA